MLIINNIFFSYNNSKFIEDFSLRAEKNKITSLLGPSGSGKSTIFKIISGFEKPNSGKIQLNSCTLNDGKKFVEIQNRNITHILQESCFFPHKNIYINVDYALKNKTKNVSEILNYIGISHLSEKFPNELSGGERQLASMAIALARDSELILLDEPCSSLDYINKIQIRKKILEILREMEKTVVLITHDPYEAMYMSDYVYIMQEGKIVQYGTSEEIYQNPSTKYVLSFFGEINTAKIKFKNNKIYTDFGNFDKDQLQFKSNNMNNIFFRPNAISINAEGSSAKVKNIKFLGEKYIIKIVINDNSYIIESNIKYYIDDEMKVKIDPKKIFIFN